MGKQYSDSNWDALTMHHNYRQITIVYIQYLRIMAQGIVTKT